ncbi:MAG: hypothetical protein AAB211_08070 [Pseudomonadota bacterium]
MATKKTTANKPPAATPAKKVTPVTDGPRAMAPHEIVLSPACQTAIGISAWGKFAGAFALIDIVSDLREQIGKIEGGNMSSVEAMLYGQAMTLQTMFTSLVRQAASETGLKQYQAKLTFALKAQAQCRSTLEALAEIKNPRPVSFVKQANIANGPQQVNNGAAAGADPMQCAQAGKHAEKSAPEQTKLLEADHGNYLDTRAQGAASRANPHMATVG